MDVADRLSSLVKTIEPLTEEKQQKKETLLAYMKENNLTIHETDCMIFKCKEVTPKPSWCQKNLESWLEDFDENNYSVSNLIAHCKLKQDENQGEAQFRLTMTKRKG